MKEKYSYSDHIRHYQLDGEFYDFFEPDKFMLQEIRRRYQEFFYLAPLKNHEKILEIGSGGGFVVENFGKKKPFYIPLDIPVQNLRKIRNRNSYPVSPCCGDAYKLPFRSATFERVVMAEVLEHLAEPEKVLQELRRILKPDGLLMLSVPYKEKISYQICIHCNKPTPTHSHLHSFDKNSLSKLVVHNGFKPVSISKSCNKVPNRLHLNYLLRNLPFILWKTIDRIFNFFIDKPISLILIARPA
ncbi:MAG: class I SAM-dependent methyltransferase [Calditrichaeota bacterium]|nr:class I SAM-dependent methyltransferase [Calditrichota bacterium]RQW07038.1 MAG: class I SAM-dependent methyltransferase [Calditrichota bacterium]